jgi:hypothetical protein
METEIVNKSTGIKTFIIVFTIVVLVFLIYFAVMSVLSPGRKLMEIRNDYALKTLIDSTLDKRIFSDSTYLKLLKERAYLQSKNIMAATDSIYLTIDMADSSANLEISGVVVHHAKMSKIEASSIFLHGDENIILNILATPFTIASSFSTILKDPVMVKMAPKDTSEYKPDIMPDTSIAEPVNFILEMTNGTRIFVYQEEADSSTFRRSQFRFDLKFRLADTRAALKSVARFKIPEYHPYIKIKLPRADAKILYRALPKYGQVGVYRK